MKSIFILILASLLTSGEQTKVNNKDNFIGTWSMAMSTTEASNMDVCHRFVFRLSEDGKGNLGIELSLPNEPNNFSVFMARIPFDYQMLGESTNEYTRQIEVQYDNKVDFNHIQNNLGNKYAVPVAFMDYVEKLELILSDLETNYQLSLDGHNYLVIQDFSLVGNSSFANFKRGGGVESCNDLK